MRKRNYNLKLTGLAAAMASLGTVFSLPAHALEVVSQGDLTINVDTTLSVGASFRASDVNYENVGRYNAAAAQNGGTYTASTIPTPITLPLPVTPGVPANNLPPVNTALGLPLTGSPDDDVASNITRHRHSTGVQDNSDLRWEKDKAFSEIVKGTIDIQAEYQDYGAFVRGRFFYDNAIVKDEGGNTLPAFYPTTDSGQPAEPVQKEGRGAEFLDAFVWGNWNLGENPLNVRLGQQVINWGEGVLFPNGINTVNPIDVGALLSPGAELKEALIPVKMLYGSLGLTDALSIEAFYQFQWRETRTPDCGTFFNTIDLVGDNCYGGFYAFGFDTNQTNQYLTLLGLSGVDALRLPRGEDMDPDDGGEFGFSLRYYIDAIQTEVGVYAINYHSRLPILSGHAPSNASAFGDTFGGALPYITAISQRLTTSDYVLEYPEDIQLFGLSFNTNFDIGLPGGESAFSGEISYRKDQPFQIEDSVLLTGLIGAPSQICAEAPEANCLEIYNPSDFISGGIRDDFYQAELAFIHFFDQLLGADRWTVLVDMAYNYANIPDKNELLMNSAYNADLRPAWSALIDPALSTTAIAGTLDRSINDALYASGIGEENLYPTKSSYGYKLRFSGEYSNVFAGVNLVPTISFSHDLKGVTPGPVANFLEDRKALGLSLEANYLNMYKVDVGYTDFFGAEPYNQLNDRDYYSISASVSF